MACGPFIFPQQMGLINNKKRKDLQKMLLGKLSFLHTLYLENEEQTSEKKLKSNVSQVKRSPHAKIQLFLSTFKNRLKI